LRLGGKQLLKVDNAVFYGSFVKLEQLPRDNKPEIALVGRSNVGKSSLINRVLNRKNLAKSSSTPGKTRTINYYLIENAWYFVDLPGYGYARVSKAEQKKWGQMIESFLLKRQQLRGVIHLLDIRHPPSQDDILMKKWLQSMNIPTMTVATKADKLSRSQKIKSLETMRKILELPADLTPLSFSSQTGEGVEEIHEGLAEILALNPQ